MDKLFNSNISIEKMAAFFDGNLTFDEMQKISKAIDQDDVLTDFVKAKSEIDETIESYSGLELPSQDIINGFEIPNLEKIVFFEGVYDSYSEKEHLLNQEGITAKSEIKDNSETLTANSMETTYRTFGEAGENTYDPIFIKQPDDHSCGLRSQQIILRDFGIDIPFKDLEKLAIGAGVYSEDGTYTYDIGKVLEMAGVPMHQIEDGTIYDLTNELAQGHRIIVSVDAHELWYNNSIKGKLLNWFDDVFGDQGGNHALIVAGVEVNPFDKDDVKVVLTDPGKGDLRFEYPLNQFMDAWKDSNCFMAATNEAAPFQYDVLTGMEVPSNFAMDHHYNQFVVDNSYQLNPDMINVPIGYHPSFTGHLHMVGDITYEDYLQQHPSLAQACATTEEENLYPNHYASNENEQSSSPFNGTESTDSVGDSHLEAESTGSVGTSHLGAESTGSVGISHLGELENNYNSLLGSESTGSVGSIYEGGIQDGAPNEDW